jgi:ribosomal protein L13E
LIREVDKMQKMIEFYSVKLRKKIKIPKVDVKEVVRKGRKFQVGIYNVKGKDYEAWKIIGKA